MKETKKQKEKIAKVMHEFKEGELHIGKSDKVVKNPKQAMAIALNEAHASKMETGGGIGDLKYGVKFKKRKNVGGNDREVIIEESNKTLKQIEKTLYKTEYGTNGWYIHGTIIIKDTNGTSVRLNEYTTNVDLQKLFNEEYKSKMEKGGKVDRTITVEVYGGKKINYTNSEIQEMIDEIDMYMSSDNLPKWIIQSRKNGNINFPKDKKGVLEFLNKIKDSKSDVYINVNSNIPIYKHYVKMAKGGGVDNNIVYFTVDNDAADTLLHENFESYIDYENLENGDVLYKMDRRNFERFEDLAYSTSQKYEDVIEEVNSDGSYMMAKGGKVEKQETKKNDKYFIREEYDSNGNKYNAVNLSYETGLKDIEYYKKDKSYVYENGAFYKKSTGNLSMIFRESKLYSEGGNIGECYYTIGGL